MTSIRVGTFNVENLFARYRFRRNYDPIENDGFSINNLAFDIYDEPDKRITAKAILECDADIMALQEVENLLVLDSFHSRYMRGKQYPYRILIDGNDPRRIDVAVFSKHPINWLRTYRHEHDDEGRPRLFSRDLLEIELDVDGRPLRLFVNHLKSMMGGREETRPRRLNQANRVAAVVDERCGPDYDGNFIVLGDMNDYPQDGDGSTTALGALLDHPELVNIVTRLPKSERWTHWYKSGRQGERARQLDYLLVGRKFDERAGKPTPCVYRNGLPWRAAEYDGERLDNVGEDNPKASDHCPLFVDIPLAALD